MTEMSTRRAKCDPRDRYKATIRLKARKVSASETCLSLRTLNVHEIQVYS